MPTGRGITRRQFVTSTAGVAAGGAVAYGVPPAAAAGNGDWPAFGYDASNRRYNPNARLSGGSASEEWMLSIASPASSGIVAVDSEVYFADGSGLVYRVTEQGDTMTYDQGVGGLSSDPTVRAPPPTVRDGTLYITGLDGGVHAIEAATGDTIWSFEPGEEIYASPTVTDGRLYIGTTEGSLFGIDLDSGDDVWAFTTSESFETTACYSNGTIVAASRTGSVYAVDEDTGDGTAILEMESGVVVPPAGGGEMVYIASHSGTVYGINTTTETTQWETNIGGSVTREFAVAEDRLYLGTDDGELVGLERTTGDIEWQVSTTGGIDTGVVATEDALAVGVGDGIEGEGGSFQVRSVPEGELLWEYDVDSTIITSPTVGGDTAYFGTEMGSVHAITSDAGALHAARSTATSAASWATTTASEIPPSALWVSGGIGALAAAAYAGMKTFGAGSRPSTSSLKTTNTDLANEAAPIRETSAAAPSATDLDLSNVTYDEFNQIQHIGSGGSADVHKAEVTVDGKTHTIALKTPRMSGGDTVDASSLTEFLDEADVWDSIDDHNRIVTVYAWGEQPVPWIAMELMEGGTLSKNMSALSLEESFAELEGLCEALHHAHRHGITHTDIKPENILFSESPPNGIGKLTDWGLANVMLEHSMSVYGLTPDYSAPEQLEPEAYGGTDDRTDIYQLGAVAYELFTGQLPHEGTSHGEVVRSILSDNPSPPSELNPDLPTELDEVLLTALASGKQDRYETALHFRDDLRRAYHSSR